MVNVEMNLRAQRQEHTNPNHSAGFTLAELLIVVAIIAVLVAIAIPIFNSQLEKSRESVDLSNVRAAYAEVRIAAMTEDAAATYDGKAIKQSDGTYKVVVEPLKQQADDFATDVSGVAIGEVPSSKWIGSPKAGGQCEVKYDPDTSITTVKWMGSLSASQVASIGDTIRGQGISNFWSEASGMPNGNGTYAHQDDLNNMAKINNALANAGYDIDAVTYQKDSYTQANGTNDDVWITTEGRVTSDMKGTRVRVVVYNMKTKESTYGTAEVKGQAYGRTNLHLESFVADE